MATFLSQKEQGAELHELIAAADAVNHAIPTHQELSRSMTKLARCGILVGDEGRFRIVSDFLPTLHKAYKGRGGLFATAEKGMKWLRRNAPVQKAEHEIVIEAETVHAAYRAYLAAVRKR